MSRITVPPYWMIVTIKTVNIHKVYRITYIA